MHFEKSTVGKVFIVVNVFKVRTSQPELNDRGSIPFQVKNCFFIIDHRLSTGFIRSLRAGELCIGVKAPT